MVQFNKLRLTGFKSFVETTEMDIGAGLTGIIGPNGCGKSNLVEALRWVMGETSAKRMRGSGMEDVIFNGTDKRPARNIADVTLWLDNSDRKAPAELNYADELEITRRIERDKGSDYKVNGKTVRAKDVQLLFADVSIGANSPALVSQGRVADLINAKPTQRRLILEEAAGISGLHARRHEAELKLRGAETNLTRVEDVLGQMETQLGGLKKQARQATRYRNITGHIEKAEGSVLYLKYSDAMTAIQSAKEAFDIAENTVRDLTVTVTQKTTTHTEQTTKLPELRKAESESSARLQHIRITYSQLEAEEERLEQETAAATSQLMQSGHDLEREEQLAQEAQDKQTELSTQLESLEITPEDEEKLIADIEQEKSKLENVVAILEEQVATKTEDNASRIAKRNSIENQIEKLGTQIEHLKEKQENLSAEKKELLAETPAQDKIKSLEGSIETLIETYQKVKSLRQSLEEEKLQADEGVETAFETHQDKQSQFTHLNAEADAIRKVLYTEDDQNFPPVIDSLSVEGGFEKALAAALGDDLQAALNEDAPIHWRALPKYDDVNGLPKGVKPLLDFVDSPPALERCLSQIGVVDTSSDAQKLMKDLKPGQCLVTHDGAAFRWDGLSICDDAVSPSAQRLEQRNRLKDMQAELEQAAISLKKSEENLEKLRKKRSDIEEKLKTAREETLQAEETLDETRTELENIKKDATETTESLSRLTLEIENTENTLSESNIQIDELRTAFAALPKEEDGREVLVELRENLTQERTNLIEVQSKLSNILREKDQREQRIKLLKDDLSSWKARAEQSTARLDDLKTRKKDAEEKVQALANRPNDLEDKKDQLRNQITEAEAERNAAADLLAEAERENMNLQRDLKTAEAELSDAREARALAQASVSTAQQSIETLTEQIQEKFSCDADALVEKLDLDVENLDATTIENFQSKLERLIRERDNMGPVNLRADVESQELITQMDVIETERDDLISAIQKLRQGISKLNKEARERLLAAFDTVNKNFGELFESLFGGGRAYLELTNDDDPLDAGLEIYAQPPGKKLQVLSLFSGGEQTLTSIALIFGMFLTNPAPICVLDEIDAPLDDSNVDRVCTLLEKMAAEGETRFIVITHHRMTMARMDRLYGVTMSERGVSQLVSVDMSQGDLFEDELAA